MAALFQIPSLKVSDKIETEDARKEVYLRYFVFYLALFSLLYSVISVCIGYKEGAVITFCTFLWLVLLSVSKRFGLSMVTRTNLLVMSGTLDVYCNALFTGGIESPVGAWLVFIPLLSLILSTYRWAVFWLVISLVLVTSLYIFSQWNIKLQTTYNAASFNTLFQFLVLGGLVALVFFILSFFDSLKNKAIDAMNETQEELLQAQKYKDRFIATVSHELRTPMNAIIGVTGLLGANENDKEKRELLDGMKNSADHLLVLINDILDLSRMRAGKMYISNKNFSLQHTIENCIKIFRPKAVDKRLALNYTIQQNLPDILVGDASRLTQILNNLVGNALKFTKTGHVNIDIKGDVDNNKALVTLQVSDTGIGMAADKLDKIFASFEQVDEHISAEYGGSGLGLAITHQIVELLGGTINVKSEPEKGSIFTVTLSFAVAATQIAEPALEIEAAMVQELAGVKILLVEDSFINRLVACKQIELMAPGILIDIACNGQEAVDMATTGDYDLILMDVLLPNMSGIEATTAIRKKGLDVKIIAMTASVMETEVKECYDAGMNDFISKPFDKFDLLRKIYLQYNHSQKGSLATNS